MNPASQSQQVAATAPVDYLLPQTVSLVVACINANEVAGDELPGLVKGIHSTLCSIAVSTGGFPAEIPAPRHAVMAEDMEPTSDVPGHEAIMGAIEALGLGDAAAVALDQASEPFEYDPPEAPEPRGQSEFDFGSAAFFEEVIAEMEEEEQASAPPLTPAPVRAVPAAKAKPAPAAPKSKALKLPKGLASVDEALGMDLIVCLEDGRKVKDLAGHLSKKGMSMSDYRRKWELPEAYPSVAPDTLLRRGQTYEYDIVTGRFREVR